MSIPCQSHVDPMSVPCRSPTSPPPLFAARARCCCPVAQYAAFADDERIYLVMEFAEMGDLFDLVKQHGGRLSEDSLVRCVIAPYLDAVAYMHARGIIHRCGTCRLEGRGGSMQTGGKRGIRGRGRGGSVDGEEGDPWTERRRAAVRVDACICSVRPAS
eukprot:365365-Chlamydomonas_euryale.AAC.4